MSKKSSLFEDVNFIAILIFAYYGIFGTFIALAYTGPVLMFFLASIIISTLVTFLRSVKSLSNLFRAMGNLLFVVYIAIMGPAAFFLLGPQDLNFFLCLYLFALAIFYIRDPDRIKKEEELKSSNQ